MKILVVTARDRYVGGWLRDVRSELSDLGEFELTVLAVHPPKQPRKVDRFVVVDPSVVPFRPAVDAPVLGRTDVRSRGRHVVSVMRTARKAWQSVAGKPSPGRSAAHLAIACRTSRLPVQLAREADLVIALDDTASLGVWHLAQRVSGPLFVHGTGAARDVARRELGIPAPAVEDRPASEETESVGAGRMPAVGNAPVRLLVAPMNHGRQARRLADTVRARVPGATAQSFALGGGPDSCDLVVDAFTFATDLAWRRDWRRHVLETYTHVLAEAGRPILGGTVAGIEDQYLQLQRAGLSVARVAHGTEIRVPSVDAGSNPWAPYADMNPVHVRQLEGNARRNVEIFTAHDGPVFVSSLGLLRHLPKADWLPFVLDTDEWVSDAPVLAGPTPVVAHAPGRFRTGLAHVEPLLRDLEASGAIVYRRVGDVGPERRLEAYGTADVVVDQFALADYDQAACEAMSLGRVVVGHVGEDVRSHVVARTGEQLPVVEATPETLTTVLRDLVGDRERAAGLAAASRRFARTVHSGELAAKTLRPWLLGGAS